MTGIRVRIAAVLRAHGDLCTRVNADYLAGVLAEQLGPDVEKVAEAIWRADINNGHRDFIAEWDVSWADDIGDVSKNHYRRLARDAVAAMGWVRADGETGGAE